MIIFKIYLLFLLNMVRMSHSEGFNEKEETRYLSLFDILKKDSYTASIPQEVITKCKNQMSALGSQVFTIKSSMTSDVLQQQCGTNTICTIPVGLTVTMNSNLNLAALVVQGTLEWTDNSQFSNEQYLCAGYIAVNGGLFNMNLSEKKGFIYIKNNNLKDSTIFTRVLGSYNRGKINIIGRYLQRTWSLLARTAHGFGAPTISLLHNPKDMGWREGDRIVIAPTEKLSRGEAEDFVIGGFEADNSIKLLDKYGKNPGVISSVFKANPRYTGVGMSALMNAEVINLSRNILITGDDFEHVQCQMDITGSGPPPDNINADHCSCWPGIQRTKCTLGLHTISLGEGSVLSLQYARIEKCGQRGILGKYCTHLHLNKNCTECKIIGNAIEFGQQRGISIHGTHLATIEYNVYNDIRGANIYIEDGNEMYNRINYNVAICPWKKDGIKAGCTVPGTNNEQADTTYNQAGLWGLSFTNYVIGNRFANHFNGMLYQEQGFGFIGGGRGDVNGKECLAFQQIGRLEGNTFHGHGRFGTYVLADVYPKNTDRTLARNGLPILSSCKAWTSNGEDNGVPATFLHNVDYDNAFVGQYMAGDLQYRFHTSIQNLNLIYWKETKNFQDGCSAHLADSFFEQGDLSLPGGHGTFILENMIFKNRINFESSHHCNVGVTGVLCMPTYVFVNMSWTGIMPKEFSVVNWGPNNGAMFTLGPEDKNEKGNFLFPAGFISIAHPYWKYLMALDGGTSCFDTNQVASLLKMNLNDLMRSYHNMGAIFCKRPLRRLEIFSFNQNGNGQNMRLELWQGGKMISSVTLHFFQIGGTKKQGYSATIVPGLNQEYRLSMENGGNVPTDWIIEFSDPIFGNRWTRDEIYLTVAGRTCPSPVHSQHDRRFIWSGEESLNVKGRGACTSFPDMPSVNCKSKPKLSNIEYCPNSCPNNCKNGYCDCATGQCLCNPGFTGNNCETDLCAAAGCVNGNCAAKYLGGDLIVSNKPCICKDGWYGDKCDTLTKPADPPLVCTNGYYFFIDMDILGGNIAVLPNTPNPKDCAAACNANPTCKSWVSSNGGCDLRIQTQRVKAVGIISGIKCSALTDPNDSVATDELSEIDTSPSNECEGKCQGNYPHSCNPSMPLGYCNAYGGCSYSSETANDPNWCCFKGCKSSGTTKKPVIIQTTKPTQAGCDGRCKGIFPYGCNPSFSLGYCNSGGGCTYDAQPLNDPNWCCFKGC